MDGAKKCRYGAGLSTWLRVKTYSSPFLACAILILVGGNLSATVRMRALLQDILASGIAQAEVQESCTEWMTDPGIACRVITPRNPKESDEAHATRHANAVRALTESFPPTIK